MLIGRFDSRISAKGRISLPSRFVKILGKRLIVSRWYENCVVLVSAENWDKFLSRITLKDDLITKNVRGIDRFIMGSSYLVEVDSQARFVVPRFLRAFASLENEIVFLGLGDRVEIWDKNLWQIYEKNVETNANRALEKLAKRKNE